jgi:aminoglycoside phosphotransferase (APT) family kinase protein
VTGDPVTGDPPAGDPAAGVAAAPLTDWFTATLGATPPVRFERLAGGYSNLTFLVADADGMQWVLRRPPLGHVLATAHDMDREGGIMAALAGTGVPVPAVLGRTSDPQWNGAPFFVMSFVPGQVLRTPADTAGLAGDDLAAIAYGLFDVLAQIHAVDLDTTGLAGLARGGSYAGRQLRRWYRQWQQIRVRDLPLLEELHTELAARVPDQPELTLIHGDYRLDNVILGPAGQNPAPKIRAVLDWELATVGDPLADLGLALAYWTEPQEAGQLPPAPTDTPGFPSRREVAARYSERSGRPDSDLSFYVALAHWKVACMAEGVYTRHRSGDMGTSGADMDLLRRQPAMRARAARRVLDGGL